MSNPKLTVEFEARNESAVIASINRVSGVGQTYVEKWVADTRSATSRNEASYTSFWNKVLNEQDRATREMFAMNRTRLAEQEKTARAAAKIEEAASKEIVRQKKIETDALIAEGKRAIDAQNSALRQKQLAMESRVSNAGGYGPTAPTQSPDRMATAINTGMVNAAAFLNVATSAYYMASKAVAVVSSFVMDAAKWEAMDMGLRNMEGSAEGAAAATERLYQIAKAPGIDLETATKGYTQLRAMHMAGKDAERTIVDISNTVARAGGGSVAFERTMNQLKDMLATGTVYQKDLKIMKEAMPELTTLMQKAFGTTTAEGIRNLHVNANEFLQGILAEMEKLPKAQQTLTSEIENTGVAWSRLKAAFVDTDFTKRVLSDFTGMLEGMTKILNAKSINWGRLVMGILSGRGVEQGAYANGKEKDLAEVTSFFDKKEAKDVITGVKQKAGKNYRSVDSSGKTREDWIAFINKKWENAVPPAPNSEGVAAGDQKKEKKTERDPIAEDRKRLAEQLRLRQISVDAEKAYNGTIAKLTSEGIDEREATAIADRDKAVELKRKEYEALEKDAHGSKELLKQLEKQKQDAMFEEFVKGSERLNQVREKISKEQTDKDAEYQKAEDAANKAHQARVDERNQEQIDKNRAKNIERAGYVASQNKYTQIDFESNVENYKIVELFKDNEKEMTRQLEIQLAKRKQLRRDAEAEDLIQFTQGSSQMANSLAENIKAGIDYSYNAKKKAIEDEYAMAERAGTATAEMRKNKDKALADLDAKRESDMKGSYATMFRITKSFEIASASVQLAAAAMKALNDPTAITAGQKLANVGLVMAAGANLVSQITSAQYSGMFDKGGVIGAGKWGIAGENGPEIIQGPAHVTSTRDTARLIGSSNGAPNVTVNNYAGAAVSTRTMDDGSLEVIIQRAAEAAENRIAGGIASGGGKVSQQMSRTFGVRR